MPITSPQPQPLIVLLIKTTDPKATAWVHLADASRRRRRLYYRSFFKHHLRHTQNRGSGVDVWMLKSASPASSREQANGLRPSASTPSK